MTLTTATCSIDKIDILANKLIGHWSRETWLLRELPIPGIPSDDALTGSLCTSKIKFGSLFPNQRIRLEMQYGCMIALQSGHWSPKGLAQGGKSFLNHFSRILDESPSINSILDRTWEEWKNDLTDWYMKNYPKRFRTSKTILKDPKCGFRVSQRKESLEQISRFKKMYEEVKLCLSDEHKDEWEKDIVSLEVLGYRKKKSEPATLNFSDITPEWLKSVARNFIKEKLRSGDIGSISAANFLKGIRVLVNFISENEPNALKPEDIDREFIKRLISHVNALKTVRISCKQQIGAPLYPKTKDSILRAVRVFIRESARMGLATFPVQDLFEPSDFPEKARDEFIKHIPDLIFDQMVAHLGALSEPWHSIMAINQEVGARIGDSLLIPLECLTYDDDNNPYLNFESQKTNDELYPLPIQPETYEIIKAAQARALSIAGEDCKILFPANNKGEPYSPGSIERHLRKWIVECDIRDENGAYWQINTRQCRHTVAMSILNNGGTEADVQYMLKQRSAASSRKYARLLDKTKKLEWAKYTGLVVDCRGNVVDNLDSVNSIDAQWLKHNLRTQALPNGYCKKPVTEGECEHANRCLRCKSYRTGKCFLPVHKEQLANCNTTAKNARAEGRTREAQINETTAGMLGRLIERLEMLNDGERANARD